MPSTSRYATPRSAIAILVAVAAAACSATGEKVFTRQNKAASALATMAMEAETKSPSMADRLYEAEIQLHKACAPLREVASRRMTGEKVGFDVELVAFVTLTRCEFETARVEDLIRLDNPAVARTFLSPTVETRAIK